MKAVLRQLVGLSWPLALAQETNALGGVVGGIILAKSSVHTLAATLPASMLACTFTAFFSAFLSYSGTLVARHDGSGDAEAGVSSFLHGLVLTFALLPVFALFVPFGRFVFTWFGHAPETLAAERLYFTYLLASGYLATLAGVLGGFLTGRGDTRFTGIVQTSGNILNILLLPPLAIGNHALAGIHGAGLASILANGTVTTALLVRIIGILWHSSGTALLDCFRPDRQRLFELLRLGIPSGLRQLVDCGGFFVFTALIARLDPISVAASTALFAINNLHHAVREGIQRGVEILTGRTAGTTEGRLVIRITVGGLVLMALTMAAFAVILYSGKDLFFGGFLSATGKAGFPRLMQTVERLLPVLWINLVLEGVAMVLAGVYRGLGRTPRLLAYQTLASAVVWLPLVFLVHAFRPSAFGFWLTMPVCSAVLAILLLSALISSRRRCRS